MLGVLSSDFVRTARASGLSSKTILWVYAFQNAILPVLTTLGMVFSFLSGANVLVEKVFAWPGIGPRASRLISMGSEGVGGIVGGSAGSFDRHLRQHAEQDVVQEDLQHDLWLGITPRGAQRHVERAVFKCERGVRFKAVVAPSGISAENPRPPNHQGGGNGSLPRFE